MSDPTRAGRKTTRVKSNMPRRGGQVTDLITKPSRRYKKRKTTKQKILADDARGYRKRRVEELRAAKNADQLNYFIGKNRPRRPVN